MTIRDHQPRQKTRSKLSDERETPQDKFDDWDFMWDFTVDAAASKKNHKLPLFWTRKDNGLKQDWGDHRVWVNPPYSDITPWIEKAMLFEADLAVLLVPAWTDRQWFQRCVLKQSNHPIGKVTLNFLPGRLRFGKPGSKKQDGPAPFPCMLMIFERVAK